MCSMHDAHDTHFLQEPSLSLSTKKEQAELLQEVNGYSSQHRDPTSIYIVQTHTPLWNLSIKEELGPIFITEVVLSSEYQ